MTGPETVSASGSASSRPGRPAFSIGGPAIVAVGVALVLVVAYLVSPLMGADLSAQLSRADFARDHASALIDFRWFGGTLPYGYSLWVPVVAAYVGTRSTGAACAVIAAGLAAYLFRRAGAKRPALGGVAAAVCQASSLAEGRVAFGAGMVFGLITLTALSNPPRSWRRRVVIVVSALLTAGANPVAALLLAMCGVVAIIRGRRSDGVVTIIATALPVIVISVIFADGSRQVFNPVDALRAGLVTMLCFFVCPRRFVAIRWGAALGLLLVVGAYVIPSPVGSNATRLSLLFAVPIVAAFVEWRAWRAAVAIVAAVVIQTPVVLGTLTGAGTAATTAAYYRPLLDELGSGGPLTGRVEIPELIGHWEAYYAARDVPLARGWLRQVDTQLNGKTFYDRAPTADSYQAFLARTAVQYVAVPDARLTFYGRREKALIASGLPYLHTIWRDSHWTLYKVTRAITVVSPPATLERYGADELTITAPAKSVIAVRLRWFDWLALSSRDGDACIARSGDQVSLHTNAGGTYVIGSALTGRRGHC
ncbi:MAG: hypothetical protein JO147_07630 [Actinobacteria bacterium]|nr:hypothetical protein [Actinomycetota bacterium]